MPRSKSSMERTAERYKVKRVAISVTLAAYDPITEMAARECKALYHQHDDNLYTVEERTQLGKAALDPGRQIMQDGHGQVIQARANGTPLAPLPRYTS